MLYLLSYAPLANSTYGRGVAAQNGIAPYVDASCRREPDFELDSAFVSGLCRPRFIATLAVGDVLVYVTKKSTVHREGRRLVAVLQLNRPFASHAAAAAWYQAKGLRVPYSCIVPGNDPLPIDLTNPNMTSASRAAQYADSKVWDRFVYKPRAKGSVKCFPCSALFLNLHAPPIVNDEFWVQFGCDPKRTQNAGLALQQGVYDALLKHAGILPVSIPFVPLA